MHELPVMKSILDIVVKQAADEQCPEGSCHPT